MLCLCCIFCPRSSEGNSGLHSTRFNYSSFYGRESGHSACVVDMGLVSLGLFSCREGGCSR